MDQKKLRELMKKEKEQRASTKNVHSAPGRRGDVRGGVTAVARQPSASGGGTSRTASGAQEASLKTQNSVSRNHTSPAAMPAIPTKEQPALSPAAVAQQPSQAKQSGGSATTGGSGMLLGAYDEDSDDDPSTPQEAPQKRARAEAHEPAMPPPPVPAPQQKRVRNDTDAAAMPLPAQTSRSAEQLAMPPPSMLPAKKKPTAVPVQQTADAIRAATSSAQGAEPVAEPSTETASEAARKSAETLVVAATASLELEPSPLRGANEAAQAGGVHDDTVEDTLTSGLPEGFFDDPEADARARGVETPAERQQRELEESLKKFEKEMAVDLEIAEETRNELDEERFEEVQAEEEEFQGDLFGRIEMLRKRQLDKGKAAEVAAAVAAQATTASEPDEDEAVGSDDEDSGSDVEFDWRAKGFS